MSGLASDGLELATDGKLVGRTSPADGRILTAASVLLPMGFILASACLLRAWGLGAPFASSDQVSMPYFVRHGYGIKWLFAHSYGPVPAVLLRSFAELASWFRLPIGEMASRLPIAMVSVAQVMLTCPLMRRMWCSPNLAVLGSLICALLPPLVTDGHYAWGYLTIWLFLGTLSLWATLAYLDDRRGWQLFLASLSLLGHCLSNCFAFGLPLTLPAIWVVAIRRAGSDRNKLIRGALMGFVMPCTIAAGVIIASWLWTGQGQIGRLLAKQDAGVMGWSAAGILSWSAIWLEQFGYLFVVPATAGLIYGLVLAVRGRRAGLLALWAGGSLLPLVLLSNPSAIGYPGAYLLEAVFAAGMLAVALAGFLYQRLAQRRAMRAAIAGSLALSTLHLGAGAVDACLTGGRLYRWTGTRTGWGSVAPDTGIKAAGWYVRQNVPMEWRVMTLHTNGGMESPVAEYYLGRRVIAGLDVSPRHVRPLLAAMAPLVDVVIAEPDQQNIVESIPGFAVACTITRGGSAVRLIYLRSEKSLPPTTLDADLANARYDRTYTPRRVPLALPAPPGFEAAMREYKHALRQLRAGPAAVN